MNKALLQMLVFGMFSILTIGCTALHQSQPSAPLQASLQSNLYADLEVGEDITGDSTVTVIIKLIRLGSTTFADGVVYAAAAPTADPGLFGAIFGAGDADADAAKAAAAYDACKKSNADVIVAPRYEVTINDFIVFKTVTARVWGKKGTIRRISDVRNK